MNQNTNPEQRDNFDQMLIDGGFGSGFHLQDYLDPNNNPRNPNSSRNTNFEGQINNLNGTGYTTWADLIASLQRSGGDVNGALADFIKNGNLPFGDGASDQLKDIMTMFYQQASENEKRRYDSPAEQLKRLMASGMSREAALQSIQGNSAAAVPFTSGVAPSAGMQQGAEERYMHEQQKQIELQNGLAQFNAILSSVGLATSVAQFGVSLPLLRAQTALMKANAANATMTLSGVQAAGSLVGAMAKTVDAAGNALTPEQMPPYAKGYDALRNWVSSSESDVNPHVSSWKQQNPGAVDNPIFWDNIRQHYNARHEARNQDEFDKQNAIQTEIIGIQNQLAQVQFNRESLAFDLDAETFASRVEQIKVNLGISKQELSNLETQGEILGQQLGIAETQNKRAKMEFSDYTKIHNVMTDANLMEFQNKLDELTQLADTGAIKAKVDALNRDYQFQATKAYFDELEYQYDKGYLQQNANDPRVQQSLHISNILHKYFDGFGVLGGIIGSTANVFGQAATALTPKSAFGTNGVTRHVPHK